MFKSILLTSLLLFTSNQTFAAFIYADDFEVGQNVSNLTSNATLTWLEGTGNSSPSTIFSSEGFDHQHFGGLTDADTFETFPSIYNEYLGSPVPQRYAALEIDFGTAVRSFGFRAENRTGSPFALFLYDTQGQFLKILTASVVNTGTSFPGSGSIFDATYSYNFDVDVGKIKIGGASDAGYIYALDVDVPEPSSILLLAAGLLFVFAARRPKSSSDCQHLA